MGQFSNVRQQVGTMRFQYIKRILYFLIIAVAAFADDRQESQKTTAINEKRQQHSSCVYSSLAQSQVDAVNGILLNTAADLLVYIAVLVNLFSVQGGRLA